jgi:hypothetical protein
MNIAPQLSPKEILSGLNRSMMQDYSAFTPRRNPVLNNINLLQMSEGLAILHQYSEFPREIVSMLSRALGTFTAHGYYEVANALFRNIGEELGSATHGVPHYKMLIDGLFDLKAQFYQAPVETIDKWSPFSSSPSTRRFLDEMKGLTSSQKPAFLFGVVYALESSARPELIVVRELINRLLRDNRIALNSHNILPTFLKLHIETFEPGHEQDLRQIVSRVVASEEDRDECTLGFHQVMKAMEELWEGWTEETLAYRRELLRVSEASLEGFAIPRKSLDSGEKEC